VGEIGRIVVEGSSMPRAKKLKRNDTDGLWIQGNSEQLIESLYKYSKAGLNHMVAGIGQTRNTSFSGAVEALEQLAQEVLPEVHVF
jgi:hypothetical protein